MSSPREFWINLDSDFRGFSEKKPDDWLLKNAVHVIEKSAHDDLKFCLDRINKEVMPGEVDSLDAMIKIIKQHERYEKALNQIGLILGGEFEHSRQLPDIISDIIHKALDIKPRRWPY